MHGGVHGRAFNPSNNRNISGGAQWPAQIYLLYTRYDATYPHVQCRVAEPLERTTNTTGNRAQAGRLLRCHRQRHQTTCEPTEPGLMNGVLPFLFRL